MSSLRYAPDHPRQDEWSISLPEREVHGGKLHHDSGEDMRFKTDLLEAIRDGRKTVTRRVVKTEKCPYTVGRIYAATNRPRWTASGTRSNSSGGWFTLPIKIVSIRKERLADITEEDAGREGLVAQSGFTSRELFFWRWGQIHGHDGDVPYVWRIEFQRVPESWK